MKIFNVATIGFLIAFILCVFIFVDRTPQPWEQNARERGETQAFYMVQPEIIGE